MRVKDLAPEGMELVTSEPYTIAFQTETIHHGKKRGIFRTEQIIHMDKPYIQHGTFRVKAKIKGNE